MILNTIILITLFILCTGTALQINKDNKGKILDPLWYSLLNKGQTIKIPLDGYFPFATNYSINQAQSSEGINQIFNLQFNLNKIQLEASQKMKSLFNDTVIDLSQFRIMDVKTIYNQPNKIFLLNNNIIMMYSYREKSQQRVFMDENSERIYTEAHSSNNLKDYPKITIVNITAEANIKAKNSTFNCVQMQALPDQAYYKLIVLCKLETVAPAQVKNYVVVFNMEQNNRGFITHLIYNSSSYIENRFNHKIDWQGQEQCKARQNQKLKTKILQKMISKHLKRQNDYQQVKGNKSVPICQQYHIKYFDRIVIQQKLYSQTVIAYCNGSSNASSVKQIYEVTFQDQKVYIKVSSNPVSLNITSCLINAKYIAEYENGFISIISSFSFKLNLRMAKYSHKVNKNGKYEAICESTNSVDLSGYLFITSRNQSGIETIYIMFKNRIYIFESYSPNYQTLYINDQNLTLKSYAISNQILLLHFQNQNSTKLTIKAYNIKAMYPYLIDNVQYDITPDTGIYLLSVMNYLEKSNYFFIYERERNLLNLTYYDGQYVNVSIRDPAKAVGVHKLSIVNTTSQHLKHPQSIELPPLAQDDTTLPIFFKIRAFCDTQIQTVDIQQIKVNNKIFNIDLVKAVIGPLGRFYKMTNPLSSLQFVNSFHEIDITDILNTYQGKRLMTFSISTFLKDPILTFYFQEYLILNCDLEFDYYLMRPMIARCVKLTKTQTIQKDPQQIIIYQQGKFVQHEGHQIYFCRISTNRETLCIEGDFQTDKIKRIKLIKYNQPAQGFQFISVFIIFQHSFKQKDYIIRTNATSKEDVQVLSNVQITERQIEYLKYMNIRTVEYDQGYQNFLLLYMMQHFDPAQGHGCIQDECHLKETYFHIVQIYAKPQLQPNQTSHFIGHLIQQFASTQLENVFIIDNKILMLSIQSYGSLIEEYIIEDFRCIKSRKYPLYDHIITKNGSHSINSGFLFVQVQELQEQVSKYLVYNPSMNTTNIITHSFQKLYGEKILFTQKLSLSDNVMAIHGNKLITLSLPNMVIKLSQGKRSSYVPKQNTQTSTMIQKSLQVSDLVNVSFIDNNDVLKILQFKYSYDISDSKIDYEHSLPRQIQFNDESSYFQLEIDPTKITGPVSQYNVLNQTKMNAQPDPGNAKDICQFIEINSSDIFTKTKCIKYFNAKQDGIMQDFLTYQQCLYQNFTIIVTDRKILCIENMKIVKSQVKNKTKGCSIYQQQCRIFIVCVQNNGTTMNMLQLQSKCEFKLVPLPKPQFLKYNLFKMVYSNGQAIFQVPIRSQTNKIYYITQFNVETRTFDQNSVLLKHQSQQQFSTKDFTTNGSFMFLLQNGLGIYNISRRDSMQKITPDVWIRGQELKSIFQLDQEFSYVNCLDLNMLNQEILLEIGTTMRSYEINFRYAIVNNTLQITSMEVRYIYKNPWNCFNTLLSKSRYFKNMTIKMCSFRPQQHHIFSNFIPISQNKQNSYIIFYQKNFQKKQSYPFRMDIIYTNIYSNDNFQIPSQRANLLIGSLFNLLCEYDLRDSYMFNFTVNRNIRDYIGAIQYQELQEKQCRFYLNLSNQNYQKLYNITIKLDFDNDNDQFWTDWKHWIQRIFVILIIFNFIRLQLKSKSEQNRINKFLKKSSKSDSFDQQFDVKVRFNSKKSQ